MVGDASGVRTRNTLEQSGSEEQPEVQPDLSSVHTCIVNSVKEHNNQINVTISGYTYILRWDEEKKDVHVVPNEASAEVGVNDNPMTLKGLLPLLWLSKACHEQKCMATEVAELHKQRQAHRGSSVSDVTSTSVDLEKLLGEAAKNALRMIEAHDAASEALQSISESAARVKTIAAEYARLDDGRSFRFSQVLDAARAALAQEDDKKKTRLSDSLSLKTQGCFQLKGHTNHVLSLAWSPDSSKLATGSDDNTAAVWDATNGTMMFPLKGHRNSVYSVAWSPDGSKLATGSSDNTAAVWDATKSDNNLLWELVHNGSVKSVAWSPDSSKLATGSEDKTAAVWDVGSGKKLFPLQGHVNAVWSVAWSPDGKMLATGSQDNTAAFWDVGSGKQLFPLWGHTDDVCSLAWSPDSKWLATASWDNTAAVWNAENGHSVKVLSQHNHSVSSVACSPNGKKLATGSWDMTATVCDTETGRLVALNGHTHAVNSVAWSPDSSKLATGSEDNTAAVWDVGSGTMLALLRGHQNSVYSVAWSPDGSKLATGSWDNTAAVWALGFGSDRVGWLHPSVAIEYNL